MHSENILYQDITSEEVTEYSLTKITNTMKNITKVIYGLAMLTLVSCGTVKNVPYFKTENNESALQSVAKTPLRLNTGDKLSIHVLTRDEETTRMLNFSMAGYNTSIDADTRYYTVDSNGNIDFPLLGFVKVKGMTREEVQRTIRDLIINQGITKYAVVNVELKNMSVNVLGEVNHPSRLTFPRDNMTILDAITMAGDLTINGMRENVKVIRHKGEQTQIYTINLNDSKNIFENPAYNLEQGDIVYVEPNAQRRRQSVVNGNNILTPSFWISIASLISTLSVLIFKK